MRTNTFQRALICDFFVYTNICVHDAGAVVEFDIIVQWGSAAIQARVYNIAFTYEQISVIGFWYVCAIDFMRHLRTGASSWTSTSRLWANSVWWGVSLIWDPCSRLTCICSICVIASICVHVWFPWLRRCHIWPPRSILDLCLVLISS